MKGKLIVLEGLDGCGKNTQTRLLTERLKKQNLDVKYVTFPNYEDASSSLVKMYLNSEFGSSPDDVNAYAAASFYAVDRYASFKKYWQEFYENGGIILCDRYTTSNAIYQMCKLEKNFWNEYLTWLYDYEYYKLGLPRPDSVIYLRGEIEISQKLMAGRYEGDESKKDLHESNIKFLKKCSEAALYVAKKDGWKIIDCCKNGEMRGKNEIHEEIIKII